MLSLRMLAMLSIVASGITIRLLIQLRTSLGCFTERNERAQEGTRRSNELVRQSQDRLRDEMVMVLEDNQLTRDRNEAILADLLATRTLLKASTEKITHDIHHERSA